MRYYEVIFMVHPDQSDQVTGMLSRYQKLIVDDGGGTIHRVEDWGRRQLAYPIRKVYKAHYVMMNIECQSSVIKELEHVFRYNDAVLRHLILSRKELREESSPVFRTKENRFKKPDRSDPTEKLSALRSSENEEEVILTEHENEEV